MDGKTKEAGSQAREGQAAGEEVRQGPNPAWGDGGVMHRLAAHRRGTFFARRWPIVPVAGKSLHFYMLALHFVVLAVPAVFRLWTPRVA